MSTHPTRLEARVSAQERQQVILNARIEELAQNIEELTQDMNVSFKQLAEYQIATENKIDARFNKLDEGLDKIEATMATKEDLTAMASKEDLKNTASKEDLAAMENRILDAFKQLLTVINPQSPPTL